MKKVLRLLLMLLLFLAAVFLFSFLVDPANVFYARYDQTVAEILASGHSAEGVENMEEFIADKIVAAAAAAGCHRVVGEYLPTAKNKMVEHLYEQMGFTALGGGRFAAEVDRYQSHKTNIKEKTV